MPWWRRSSKSTPKPLPTSVTLEGEQVRVFAKGVEIEKFCWDELESVRVWKQDCFGVDRIWIGFDLKGCDAPVCVHEEMEGYDTLIEQMQGRCADFDAEWWSRVAFPAFELNHHVVWQSPTKPTSPPLA